MWAPISYGVTASEFRLLQVLFSCLISCFSLFSLCFNEKIILFVILIRFLHSVICMSSSQILEEDPSEPVK